jgi:ligand-binding SRPBCC domain-containing protein
MIANRPGRVGAMPRFETSQDFAFPVGRVFDVFSRPAHLERVMPPDLHFRVLEAPERLELGSRVTVQGRRWGLGQRVTSAVTEYEAGVCFVQEQVSGPFRRWAHRHEFAALADGGTRVRESIDFEPPGGVLGLQLPAAAVERELARVFAHRREKWAELLRAAGGGGAASAAPA